ncbi:haloacid dehalogenase type II [Ktedonosporobacter rubrisoli]|nr:haloacid dehalogenase type II [Ktedonosporobacter rubrisoli]
MTQEATNYGRGWVTFDCYGTLVNWRKGMLSALESIVPGKASLLLDQYYLTEAEVEAERPFRSYRNVLAEALRRAARRSRIDLLSGSEHILADTLPSWPLFPDVGSALPMLRADGWRLAILSNIDRDLMSETLRRMPASFDKVITAEDVRTYKPAEGHFRYFLEATQVSPKNWVHVAGSYFHDIVTASRLGAMALWVNREGSQEATPQAAAVLSDLRQIIPTIHRLNSQQDEHAQPAAD